MRPAIQQYFATHRLPQPSAPRLVPSHFVWFPAAGLAVAAGVPVAAVQQIYQAALEQAQAVARPSLPERDVLAYWN